MDSNKKLPKLTVDLIYLCIILLTAVFLFFSRQTVFFIALLIFTAAGIIIRICLEKSGRISPANYIGKSTVDIETGFLQTTPFPTAVLSQSGKITWYNPALQSLFGGELLFRRDIHSVVPQFVNAALEETSFSMNCHISGKTFKIISRQIPSGDDKNSVFLYFIDISETEELTKKYENERLVEMIIEIDNLDEVLKAASDEDSPSISSKIRKAFINMAHDNGGILKQLEKDRYLFILNFNSFTNIKNKKFPITETLKEIFADLPMIPTLSIGVGIDGATFEENDSFASAALDMALGRGGDQVVIRDGVTFEYFGGNSKAIERRSKVKARVVAHALRELMTKSEQVVIMGHPTPDIDCIGGAVALAAYARKNSIRTHIVCGGGDKIVNTVIDGLKSTAAYENVFIKPENAKEFVNQKTLLIVLDTHKSSFVEAPELLKLTGQVAVIDHHRRSSDYINNSVLLYHEPYASSCCEMVTEMLQYVTDKQFLTHDEASAVYAGIYLDTKAFSIKTGVRTLEAAAYLRRSGVDPIEIKKLFRSDFDTFRLKSTLMQSAKMLPGNMALVKTEEVVPQSVVAQVADELINISDIDTSFVIAPVSSKYNISARSAGKTNVQVILEKLGGGGHMSVAGAQIDAESADTAEEMLLSAIEEYLKQ